MRGHRIFTVHEKKSMESMWEKNMFQQSMQKKTHVQSMQCVQSRKCIYQKKKFPQWKSTFFQTYANHFRISILKTSYWSICRKRSLTLLCLGQAKNGFIKLSNQALHASTNTYWLIKSTHSNSFVFQGKMLLKELRSPILQSIIVQKFMI